MEFVTGVRKKETLELSKVLAPQSLDPVFFERESAPPL